MDVDITVMDNLGDKTFVGVCFFNHMFAFKIFEKQFKTVPYQSPEQNRHL